MTNTVDGTDRIRGQLRARIAAHVAPTFRASCERELHADETALVDRLTDDLVLPYELKLRAVEDENARLRGELERHGVGEYYRLPSGGGYCVSCRRPMREGRLVVRAAAPKCLLCTGEVAPEQPEFPAARDLRADRELHAHCAHPAYEYDTTQGPRKAFDRIDEPPEGDGWERNVDAGRDGWEWFNYHEESYWRRLRTEVPQQPVPNERASDA